MFVSAIYGIIVGSVDGKNDMSSTSDDTHNVLKRMLSNNDSPTTYEYKKNFIGITKTEDFVTLFPNGGSLVDNIAQIISDPTAPLEFQGTSIVQAGNLYDPSSIELVNLPEGVEIPQIWQPGRKLAQFSGGRQPRFVPDGDPFYFFHGVCVATSVVTTPPEPIETNGPDIPIVLPIITSHACKLNVCLGGGGFDCIFIYSGTAFIFNPGQGFVRNNDIAWFGPRTFEPPVLPPPYPGTIIGGTGSFEGIEGTVNIATVAGTTGPLVDVNGGIKKSSEVLSNDPDRRLWGSVNVFAPIGDIVQVITISSNIPLPSAP